MGQHQNKFKPDKDDFKSVYSQSQTHEYFTHTKGFGYRKTNINPNNHQKIFSLLKDCFSNIEQNKPNEKTIKKKLFQGEIYPFSCIGLIIVSYKDRCSFGTGCLIGPNLVLTAASNVYHKDTDQHPQIIRFVLGINQNQGDVYRVKKNMHIPEKFVEESNGSHRYNYAVLQLETLQNSIGSQKISDKSQSCLPGLIYGYLGINTRFSGMQNAFIYGYNIESLDFNDITFTIRGERIQKLVCKHGSICYKMDSTQSQCGSPVLIRRNEYFHIVGIHICGKKDLGTGLQVDEDMRKTINTWVVVNQGRMDLSSKSLDCKSVSLLNSSDWQHLSILNLDNNHLMSAGLIVFTKCTWPVLRELHLCNNEILKLQFETSSLQNLQVLYLTKNQIRQVYILSELAILRVLDLSENRIEDMGDLTHLKYLQRLYLNGNKLVKVPPQVEKLSQLRKIQLSRNELQKLPFQILKLRNLSVVSLDGNRSKFQHGQLKERLEANHVQIILN